jgi:2-phospho-L-lactate transferase/gluconeogenesis factor (CofD/UPF0052 family)
MRDRSQNVSAPSAGQIKIALFCGGRGSASIIRELLRWPNVELTLLVNAYDDGLSTGALRNFIPGMLGPSDFRKNLSYLLDLYSPEQYSLRTLIEHRLPVEFGPAEEAALARYAASGATNGLQPNFVEAAAGLDSVKARRIRRFLESFLKYAKDSGRPFDYRDCSLGNLVLAGAYLECGNSFNAAAREISRLVGSRAVLVNVSQGEDRVLAGLKADGSFLSCEAELVGCQSAEPIVETFFLPSRIAPAALESRFTLQEKIAWLKGLETPTLLSDEARRSLESADIIIYGPGTQHSSLLPSYRIAHGALKAAKAFVKVLVVNLGEDNDIQGLTADQLVDRALYYSADPDNASGVITHIMFNVPKTDEDMRFGDGKFGEDGRYRNALVVAGDYRVPGSRVHNGYAVIRHIMRLWENAESADGKAKLEIFVDLYKRAPAGSALLEEFFEIDWSTHFSNISLKINAIAPRTGTMPEHLLVTGVDLPGPFPEVRAVLDWLKTGDSGYLVTITGDGEYRFRDVLTGVRVLRDSVFGAIYGSRTQSRRQFRTSLQAAYGDGSMLRVVSWLGAFLLSVLFGMRFGVIFSDPLTGFRIYRRRYVQCLASLERSKNVTPTTLTRYLVENNVEIAELPVRYRTYIGFTDRGWRLNRGLKNLLGLMRK